jgi:hypothetical protein
MSVQPGQYNIPDMQRRADYDLQLQFKDSNDSPVDLTNWTVYAQVWNKERTTKYADWAVIYTDRSIGSISLAVTDTQTETFPDECYWDVLLENPAGLRNYWLEGVIYVSEGYTA